MLAWLVDCLVVRLSRKDGPTTMPDSKRVAIVALCLAGRQSCLHAESSPLKERAEQEAKAHLSARPQEQRQQLQAALLPSLASPDVVMGQLAAPPPGTHTHTHTH